MMHNVISDEDTVASSMFVAINDTSNALLSGSWNCDIDTLFGVGTPEVKAPEMKSFSERVTSRRFLTSKEVIQEK